MATKDTEKHYHIELDLSGKRYCWVRTTPGSVTRFLNAENINHEPPNHYRITAWSRLDFLEGHSNNHLSELIGQCTGAEWLISDTPPF